MNKKPDNLGMKAVKTDHHPVFEAFVRTPPRDDATHHINFMGARIAHAFEVDLSPDLVSSIPGFDPKAGLKMSGRSGRYAADPTYPLPTSEDYFEWIDLLTAIERARDQFNMIELGAGYGRWIANAAAALNRRKSSAALPKKLIALEASGLRFEMMRRNCLDNQIAPGDVELHRAACTPNGKPLFMLVSDNFGETVWFDPNIEAQFATQSSNILPFTNERGERYVIERVPAIILDTLLTAPVDFIDIDIQGAEIAVVPAAIDALNRFAKLVHIGTHAPQIDQLLTDLFQQHGWRQRYGFSWGTQNDTPYGRFSFIDGIQSWENPRFD